MFGFGTLARTIRRLWQIGSCEHEDFAEAVELHDGERLIFCHRCGSVLHATGLGPLSHDEFAALRPFDEFEPPADAAGVIDPMSGEITIADASIRATVSTD